MILLQSEYNKTILENGIRVLSENMPFVQSVAIGVWICVGSRDELKERNGISHLLEHMVFKGTPSRSAYQIATGIESLGGYLNAFTEKEFTCFYAHVLGENLSEAVEVIADIIQNGLLDEADLENEKTIIQEEIKNLEDSPEDFVLDSFIQSVFNHVTLGYSILGSNKSVQSILRGDLSDYRYHHYTSENILIVVAGKVEHKQLVNLILRSFQNIHRNTKSPRTPSQLGFKTDIRIHSSVKQSHICTGIPAFCYGAPEKYPLHILNTILGGGMGSRLFQNLREKKGLAYSVYSFLEFWSDTGLLGIYTGTSPKNVDEALNLIDEELDRLSNGQISKEEFEATKSQLSRNLILSYETCMARMHRLAKMEIYTETYTSIDDIINIINSIKTDDVRNITQELVENRQRYTAVLEPA